jgi:hypothetical protein
MGRFCAPIIRKPGEISWLDQVHAETRRRGGGGKIAIDDAVKTFFECRTANVDEETPRPVWSLYALSMISPVISSISLVISLSPLRVSASPREIDSE